MTNGISCRNGAGIYIRLHFLYLILLSVWGAWSYCCGTFCAAHHITQGFLYSGFALGALLAPIVGPVADRKYSAQRVLAVMQAVCGAALLICAYLADKEGKLADIAFARDGSLSSPSFLWQIMMFISGVCFMPSIPLSNGIIFAHIQNKAKAPLIFLGGTLGWFLVNCLLSALGTYGVEHFYVVAAGAAFITAVYALTLPDTPPSGARNSDPFGLKALTLFKRWDFATFIIGVSLVGIFGSNYYFAFVGMCFPDRGNFNQISEMVFMTALTFAVAKIGLKITLCIGMAAWSARYFLFSTGVDSLAVVGILLHGLAYSFLYSCAYLYGDKIAGKDMKTSCQALITFALLGVSQVLSGVAADWMIKHKQIQNPVEETAVVLIETAYAQDASVDDPTPAVAVSASDGGVPVVDVASPDGSDPVVDVPKAGKSLKTWWDRDVWKQYDWRFIWNCPGWFCLVVAVLFLALGKEPKAVEEEVETK